MCFDELYSIIFLCDGFIVSFSGSVFLFINLTVYLVDRFNRSLLSTYAFLSFGVCGRWHGRASTNLDIHGRGRVGLCGTTSDFHDAKDGCTGATQSELILIPQESSWL